MSLKGVANFIPDGATKLRPAKIAEVKHLAVHPVKGQVAHPHLC